MAGPTGGPKDFFKEYESAYGKANAANEARYQDILGGYKGLGEAQATAAQGQLTGLQNAYGQAQQEDFARGQALKQGYKERYDRGLANLEGAGLQERADIGENYQNLAARQAAQLAASGLGGTTIAPTMAAGVERQRTAEEARLNERLRGERASMDERLSGDMLSAQERQGMADRSGRSEYNQMMASLAERLGGQQMGIEQNRLGFMERREDALPDLGQYAALAQAYGAGGGQGGGPGVTFGGGPPTGGGLPGGPVNNVVGGIPMRGDGVGGSQAPYSWPGTMAAHGLGPMDGYGQGPQRMSYGGFGGPQSPEAIAKAKANYEKRRSMRMGV